MNQQSAIDSDAAKPRDGQSLVALETLRETALAACARAGIPDAHAALQVSLLLEADLRGRGSHGLMRLPRIIERIGNGVLDPLTSGLHTWRGACLDVDGRQGLGPVVAMSALDALLEKAETAGVAVAAISNNNHLGMLAWYAEKVARQGMVLIAMSTSEALVHPWGGRRAMLGTNPIAMGIPTAGEPFVIDMATSLVAMGVVHDYANRGLSLPSGWALDEQGDPTNDPQAAKRGSLAPFGEAKGYALGLAIEMLVTAMTNAAIGRDIKGTLDSDQTCNKGDVFIVMAPESAPSLARRLSGFLDEVRRSGSDRMVLVPGDRASMVRRAAVEDGVPIATSLWAQLAVLSGKGTIQ